MNNSLEIRHCNYKLFNLIELISKLSSVIFLSTFHWCRLKVSSRHLTINYSKHALEHVPASAISLLKEWKTLAVSLLLDQFKMEPLVRCRTGGWWQGTRLFFKNFCKIKKGRKIL